MNYFTLLMQYLINDSFCMNLSKPFFLEFSLADIEFIKENSEIYLIVFIPSYF